jgi:hypothetical protein
MVTSAAYFDETRVDGSHRFPVVAGFWSSLEKWTMFEEEWVKAFPRIPKKHGRARSKQPDAQRYADALAMAKLIREFAVLSVYVTIEKRAFQYLEGRFLKNIKKSDAPHLSTLYAVCTFFCCEVLDSFFKFAMEEDKSLRVPIKVVFDDGNEYKDWLDRGYRARYSNNLETYLAKVPLFEDDETLPPLRAADLYAWLLGRYFNERQETKALKILKRIPSWHEVLTAANVKQAVETIDRERAKSLTLNPNETGNESES